MKLNKHSHRKSIIIGTIIMAFLVVGGITTYYFMVVKPNTEQTKVEEKPNNTVDYGSVTDEQKKSGEQAKNDFLERQEEKEADQNQPVTGTSSINISNISNNGDVLQIRTTITDTNDGQCKLTLSKQGETSILREANTQNLGSYDTCMGFDINTAGLKKGTWNVSLYYTGDPAGVVATKLVEIQ